MTRPAGMRERKRFLEPPVTETTQPFWDATREQQLAVPVVRRVRRTRCGSRARCAPAVSAPRSNGGRRRARRGLRLHRREPADDADAFGDDAVRRRARGARRGRAPHDERRRLPARIGDRGHAGAGHVGAAVRRPQPARCSSPPERDERKRRPRPWTSTPPLPGWTRRGSSASPSTSSACVHGAGQARRLPGPRGAPRARGIPPQLRHARGRRRPARSPTTASGASTP